MVVVTVEVAIYKPLSWYVAAAKANNLVSPMQVLLALNSATGWNWHIDVFPTER